MKRDGRAADKREGGMSGVDRRRVMKDGAEERSHWSG